MQIFWWQGGIHIEPENGEDTDALMRLWNAEKRFPSSPSSDGCSTGSVCVEKIQDSLVGQQQVSPSSVPPDLGHQNPVVNVKESL